MNSITEDVPIEFQEHYDKDKYAKSQSYLREKTRFGIFSGTFSLAITLVVIHTGAFGLLDNIVRSYSEHFIVNGLMFFGILFIINDIINIPFSIYGTFVIEERYDFNKTTWKTFISDKLKGYGLTIAKRTPLLGVMTPENEKYLETKETRMGHNFNNE